MSRLPSARGGSARPLSMFEAPTDYMNSLGKGSEGVATSKQSKRRSLLPQFSSSRKASEEIDAIQEDASQSCARASLEEKAHDDRMAMPPPALKPQSTASREAHIIPTRTSSSHMRLPGSATAAAKAAPSAHARAPSRDGNVIPARTSSQHQSSSSLSSAAATSGIKRTASTRLPQSPGPRTSSQRAPGLSNGAANVIPTAQKRASASIAKPPVLNTSTPGSQALPTPASPTRSATSTAPRPRSGLPPPSKPAFNTYQQHYSPVKSALPKPPIPTSKSLKQSAPVPEDEPISFEVALEQIELLQLSLLHQQALPTLVGYEASAKQKLGKMHAKLQKEYALIHEQEQEHRRQANLNALECWCPDTALLSEHLSSLSRVISDLRAHTEPGSRYSEMVETFETWADRAESILMDAQPGAAFIEALPESWRATHTSLALNMRSIQRDISMLPPLPPRSDAENPSSLEIMIDDCVLLVDGMLKELEVMTKLQKEVLQRGKARIDEQINALMSSGVDNGAQEKENWQPAWLKAN
ncbi:hypothetical protein AC578_2102 [Pseudocercospora eumusae]|uniref:Uncharacterized protein n=1 Tax=Pseudocercospora eumusae TaxID=321146 RepID=A0A139HQ90_9PEZI|nr:hypothetical protein AC578_2102 [Pseudocercospora eumusae]